MTALVTVVVAVHDVRAYLDACVDSLLAQAEADLEIVLVDDGSTDGSGARCDEYAAADARVRVVHQANAGLSAARNAGLDVARGEFVRFVDGDDWCDPDLVSDEVRVATRHDADLVVSGCHVDVLDAAGRLVSSTTRRPAFHTIAADGSEPPDVGLELVGLLGYAWNKLYRRELLTARRIRFTDGLSLVEDIVFNDEVLRSSRTVVLMPSAHVHYMQRPRTTLGTQERGDYLDQRLRALKAVDRVLTHWQVAPARRAELLDRLRVQALYAALRAAVVVPGRGLAERRRRVRTVVRSAAAAQLVRELADPAGLSLGERALVLTVRARAAGLVTLLVSARARWSGS